MATPFIQIGDGHFSPGVRNADRYRALDAIVEKGLTIEGLGAWLWPGDIFDALSEKNDRNAIDQRLMTMSEKAPVVLLYGNHDRPADLDGFANVARRYAIYVVSKPTILRFELASSVTVQGRTVPQWASFGCFPYPHKHVLVGARVAHGAIVQTADELLNPLFTAWGAKLAEAREQGDLTAFLFHANVVGAMTSVGQPNIGKEIELSAVHLALLGDIYKGGNHIHFPQEIYGARFAGSIAPNDYGEKEKKRFLIASIAPDSSYTVESVPLPSLPMYHVNLRFLPPGTIDVGAVGTQFHFGWLTLEDADVDTRQRFEDCDWADCDVRARLTFNDSDRPAVDFDAVKALFVSAARFKFETFAIPDRELRAPAVAAARTLPDKLAAMRSDGTPLPDSLRDKVTLLEQYPHDEVVAVVDEWLKSLDAALTESQEAA